MQGFEGIARQNDAGSATAYNVGNPAAATMIWWYGWGYEATVMRRRFYSSNNLRSESAATLSANSSPIKTSNGRGCSCALPALGDT